MGLGGAREGVRGVWLLMLGVPLVAASGQTPVGTASTNSATSAVVRTVQGHVVNALDGSPLARVLVTINGRNVLTDSRGHFEFPGYTDATANVTLLKPGFSQKSDASQPQASVRLNDLDASAELKLYPDVIISGVVTGRDGLPLSGDSGLTADGSLRPVRRELADCAFLSNGSTR